MAVTKEQILETVGNMTVVDIVDLISAMEEKFGVSAAVAAAAGPAAGAGPAVEEQTEFTVTMTKFGENKVSVIKVIRTLTGLGLKEAKDLVEGAPSVVKEGIPKKDAEDIKKQLEEAGAAVEIK